MPNNLVLVFLWALYFIIVDKRSNAFQICRFIDRRTVDNLNVLLCSSSKENQIIFSNISLPSIESKKLACVLSENGWRLDGLICLFVFQIDFPSFNETVLGDGSQQMLRGRFVLVDIYSSDWIQMSVYFDVVRYFDFADIVDESFERLSVIFPL